VAGLPFVGEESLIGAGNARQQGAHVLLGLPRACTIRCLNTISPGLLCPGKVTSISQDRARKDFAASAQFSSLYCSPARPYQIMAFSGCSASIAVKISIFDWTISLCTQAGKSTVIVH
jgi:hypothetical protein